MDNDIPVIKVIFLGSSGVGKTSILNVFKKSDDPIIPTIAPDNYTVDVINSRNNKVKLNIWDTAGQEQYRSMTTAYYRSVNVALVCFDYENRNDFKKWIQSVKEVSPDCNVLLVITKKDIYDENQLKEMETIADNAILDETNNATSVFVTSALRKTGIDELFGFIANCDTKDKTESPSNSPKNLGGSPQGNKGCCA